MDLKEIRVKNLNYLIRLHGRKKVLEDAGYSDSSAFNQLVSGFGSFGPKVAKRFEDAFDLGTAWMSSPHPELWKDGTPVTASEVETMVDKLEAMIPMLPEGEKKDQIIKAISRLSRL